MTERTHHPYSPSSLQALEACPSYESEDSESEAARIGSLQHACLEKGEDSAELSDAQAEAVAQATEFVACQKQILEEEARRTGGEVLDLREVYLPIDDEYTTAGTADRILISVDCKRAILIDYKMGKHAVECAKNNRQSDAYVLSVFHAYPTVEQVQVFFFQPAVKSENTTTWKRADVPELLLRIRVIVARARKARELGTFSTANPHTPTCLFCKHLAVCPAVAREIIVIARKFNAVAVDELNLTPTFVHAPENAAAGMRLAALVENWAKAFKGLVTDRALRGGPMPEGYELTSRATREIVDAATFKKIAEAYLTAEEIESTIEIGMTKIEKLIAQKAPRGTKTATIEAFQSETEQAGAIQKKAPFAFLKAKTTE